MFPGVMMLEGAERDIARHLPVLRLRVTNTGTRVLFVGSHCHFYDVDPKLSFDREASRGHHLNIAVGTMLRFEPGVTQEVELVPFEGTRLTFGSAEELPWPLDD